MGRKQDLARLEALWAVRPAPGAAKVAVVEGAPGVGKSTLLLRFAAAIADQYPGGCLYADLSQGDRPAVVLDDFLRALGIPPMFRPSELGGKAAMFRSVLANRKVLVVLDNVTAADQALLFLPGASGTALVSMRRHVPEFYERTGATAVKLDPLGTAGSRELLAGLAGSSRVAAEPGATQNLLRTCGGFPAAVRHVGELLATHPHLSLRELAEQLDGSKCLEDADRLRATFQNSYTTLRPTAAWVFRLLGSHTAGPLNEQAIAAFADVEVTVARRDLDELRAAHLLFEADDHFDLVGLIQPFAAGLALTHDDEELRAQARRRLLRWYLEKSVMANDALAPDWDGGVLVGEIESPPPMGFREAMSWCASEVETMLQLVRWARRKGEKQLAWKISLAYLPYLYLSKRWAVWLHAASIGVSAAREDADQLGLGRCLHSLGWALHELGKSDEALGHFEEGIQLQGRLGDDRGRAWTLLGIGAARLAKHDQVPAAEALRESADLFVHTELSFGAVVAKSYEAGMLASQHAFGSAFDLLFEALQIAVTTGVRPTEGLVRHGLGELHLAKGEPRAALTQFERALVLRQETGQQWAEAEAQVGRGRAWAALGDWAQARDALKRALQMFEALGDPRALEVRVLLASLGSAESAFTRGS